MMPKITKQLTLEVKVSRFINACSDDEIYELWLLLSSPRFQSVINQKSGVTTSAKKPLKIVELPFKSEQFAKAWQSWKEYKKKEFGFRYKSTISETTALEDLYKISNKNETNAIEMIRLSITKGWRGLFPVKNTNAQKPTQLTRKNFGA